VAAPTSPLKQLRSFRGPTPLRSASSPHSVPEEFGRYQFHVVAASVSDAVRAIGGLIFDQAMAGWDVGVMLDADADRGIDDRPIRILGATVTHLPTNPHRAGMLPRSHMLAVATDVMVRSEAVRRQVLAAGNDSATDVLFWGRYQPPTLTCKFVPVRHRPSAAAQVFKSHALAAGGAMAAQCADEGFYSMA
jgi:hypothetical protein